MARLILLEGIPGSGKTTLTSRLCALLREAGTPCAAWLEGQSGHPVELEHHACLTQEEYAALCAEFPGEAGAFAAHAHAEGDFLLVRYLEDNAPVFLERCFPISWPANSAMRLRHASRLHPIRPFRFPVGVALRPNGPASRGFFFWKARFCSIPCRICCCIMPCRMRKSSRSSAVRRTRSRRSPPCCSILPQRMLPQPLQTLQNSAAPLKWLIPIPSHSGHTGKRWSFLPCLSFRLIPMFSATAVKRPNKRQCACCCAHSMPPKNRKLSRGGRSCLSGNSPSARRNG